MLFVRGRWLTSAGLVWNHGRMRSSGSNRRIAKRFSCLYSGRMQWKGTIDSVSKVPLVDANIARRSKPRETLDSRASMLSQSSSAPTSYVAASTFSGIHSVDLVP
jgi:hypothetical protein